MKDVKSKSGETEKQHDEYVPDGPIRLASNAPDTRGRLNSDGTKSAIVAERPVYIDRHESALRKIAAIEPCPCPCCGDHEAVMIARRAIGAK